MANQITVTFQFDTDAFVAEMSKRVALRGASGFEAVQQEMLSEAGEFVQLVTSDWPEVIDYGS